MKAEAPETVDIINQMLLWNPFSKRRTSEGTGNIRLGSWGVIIVTNDVLAPNTQSDQDDDISYEQQQAHQQYQIGGELLTMVLVWVVAMLRVD